MEVPTGPQLLCGTGFAFSPHSYGNRCSKDLWSSHIHQWHLRASASDSMGCAAVLLPINISSYLMCGLFSNATHRCVWLESGSEVHRPKSLPSIMLSFTITIIISQTPKRKYIDLFNDVSHKVMLDRWTCSPGPTKSSKIFPWELFQAVKNRFSTQKHVTNVSKR